MVEYFSIAAEDKSKTHQFGQKRQERDALGHILRARGIWSGDFLLADCIEWQELEVTEVHAERFKRFDVLVNISHTKFPVPIWTIKNTRQSSMKHLKSEETLNGGI